MCRLKQARAESETESNAEELHRRAMDELRSEARREHENAIGKLREEMNAERGRDGKTSPNMILFALNAPRNTRRFWG